jgi:cytochrome c oxidase subunit 2
MKGGTSLRRRRAFLAFLFLVPLLGCEGPQSALDPSGTSARQIAQLWWVMLSGAIVIYVIVIGTAVFATRMSPRPHTRFPGNLFIIVGGVAFPLVVLSTLLTYSLVLGRDLTQAPINAMQIEVVGKQWWWEVRYHRPDGQAVVSANELRLPVGQPVELLLEATDVIHSFWVPSLAGKRDMVPGRVNRLVLQAEEPGVYRGQCAEYCGGPHALMAFYAIAQPAEEFAAWLDREALASRAPKDAFLARGRDLFLESGCGACHTIRGTQAAGEFGPDLTHVGGRRSLGAGILPNNVGTIAGWIADTQHIKPGNKMPSFNIFSGEELRAIAAYLASLE